MQPHKARLGLIVLAIAVALAALLLRTYVIQQMYIPQDGMSPGLPEGTRFWVNKRAYHGVGDVKRGDIVVYRTTAFGEPTTYVWRVIGLPGDTIDLKGTDIVLNGQTLPHQPAGANGASTLYRETVDGVSYTVAYYSKFAAAKRPHEHISVPQDNLYLLGDNRDDAADSRQTGSVPFSEVIGKKM